jgi:hypothetical protein
VRLTPSLYSATNRATADRRYDETVREAETARGAQRIAEVDLEQAKADLEAMGRPAGMADAFRVLLAIAFTGIVLPLAVMSNGAYKVPAWLRITLVALFVLSLAAFMQFLRGELGRAIGSPLPIFMQGRSGSSGLRGWWGRLRPPYRARRPRGSAPDAAADRTPS